MTSKSTGTLKHPKPGKAVVQLIVGNDKRSALGWLVTHRCDKPCPGVFARGHIVMAAGRPDPLLDLAEISDGSKVQAAAEKQAPVAAIQEKGRLGTPSRD